MCVLTPLCFIFLLFFSRRSAICHSFQFMCKRFDRSIQCKWNDIFKQRWFPLRQYVLQLEHIFQYQPGTNIFQIRYGKQLRFCLRVRWRILVLTLIGQYHWNSLPSAITSSSNQLFVVFTSDGSNVRSGFAASYHGKEYLHSCWPWEITANWKKGKLLRIKKIKETIVISIALKVKIVRHCSRCNTNLNV